MIPSLENPAIRQAAMPISVQQYHELSEAGIVAERTELFRGVILEKMTNSPRHVFLVQYLVTWLREANLSGCYVRKEEPLTFGDSEPEPDVAVVVGTPCEFKLQHPTTARWVIEVAVASVDLDREKAAIFAAAGVPEYWIVLADEARIEVYADPTTSGYSSQRQFAAQDGDLHSAQFPGVALDVAALFAGVA